MRNELLDLEKELLATKNDLEATKKELKTLQKERQEEPERKRLHSVSSFNPQRSCLND